MAALVPLGGPRPGHAAHPQRSPKGVGARYAWCGQQEGGRARWTSPRHPRTDRRSTWPSASPSRRRTSSSSRCARPGPATEVTWRMTGEQRGLMAPVRQGRPHGQADRQGLRQGPAPAQGRRRAALSLTGTAAGGASNLAAMTRPTPQTAQSEDKPDMKPRSRDVTDGLEKAAARGMLRAVGMGDDDWAKPQIGVASSWNEITPCNLSLRPARQGGQERRARRRRLPARVRHDLGLRRHLHGPRGHALLAGLAARSSPTRSRP